MATSLTFTGTLMASASFLLSASQLTPVIIAQGGTNGSRVYSIAVSSTTTTAANHFLGFSSSRGLYKIGGVSVPANSGNTAGTAVLDFFGNTVFAGIFQKQKDANGVPYYNLAPDTFLTVQSSGSSFLTTGTTSSIFVNGEFY